MKKKLEAELISLAHRILKLDATADVSDLQREAQTLYEKLTVLKFVEEHLDDKPSIVSNKAVFDTIDEVFESKNNDEIIKHNLKAYNESEEPREQIITPVIDTIKDMMTEMPKEEQTLEDILGDVLPEPTFVKRDADIVTPVIEKKETIESKQRSLNDKLKKGIHIGLNDRLAFISHLFNGSQEDYNRVISQLNTISNEEDAKSFIEHMVKPDYNNWEGKEAYEERFLQVVESKFA